MVRLLLGRGAWFHGCPSPSLSAAVVALQPVNPRKKCKSGNLNGRRRENNLICGRPRVGDFKSNHLLSPRNSFMGDCILDELERDWSRTLANEYSGRNSPRLFRLCFLQAASSIFFKYFETNMMKCLSAPSADGRR